MKSHFTLLLWVLISYLPNQVGAQVTESFSPDQWRIMAIPMGLNDATSVRQSTLAPLSQALISELNQALLAAGFSSTLDFQQQYAASYNRSLMTSSGVKGDFYKIAIENASVDVLIEADVQWIDPPGQPQNRQAILHLKAVDPFTAVVLAENANIHSSQRQFPSERTAIHNALFLDDRENFRQFISELNRKVLLYWTVAKPVNVKFEISAESQRRFSDQIQNQKINETIKDFLRRQSEGKPLECYGDSPNYLDFTVFLRLDPTKGCAFSLDQLKSKIDEFIAQSGLASAESSLSR